MAVVFFDLHGTLLDPAGIGEPSSEDALGEAGPHETVRPARADTLSGAFRPFSELVEATIRRQVTVRGLDAALVGAAVERAQALDPFPQARASLDDRSAAGHRVAVVTNSGREAGEKALASAGLEV